MMGGARTSYFLPSTNVCCRRQSHLLCVMESQELRCIVGGKERLRRSEIDGGTNATCGCTLHLSLTVCSCPPCALAFVHFIFILPHCAPPRPSCLPSFVPTKSQILQPLPLPEYTFTIVPSVLYTHSLAPSSQQPHHIRLVLPLYAQIASERLMVLCRGLLFILFSSVVGRHILSPRALVCAGAGGFHEFSSCFVNSFRLHFPFCTL